MKYLSTFQTGFTNQVTTLLSEIVENCTILYKDKNYIICETTDDLGNLNVPFLKNTYIILKEFKNRGITPIERQLNWANGSPNFINLLNELPLQDKSVRIRAMRRFTSASLENKKVAQLENRIESKTNIFIDRSNPDFEIMFMFFDEEHGYATIKENKQEDEHKPSSLSSDVSYLLNYLAKPEKSDRFIDPFCGSGSIGFSREIHFPCEKITMADKDITTVQNLNTFLPEKNKIEILQSDIQSLKLNAYDVLVTDPPWRSRDEVSEEDIELLYNILIKKIATEMPAGARVVILSSNEKAMRNNLAECKNLKLENTIQTFIRSKHPSLVYILSKTS